MFGFWNREKKSEEEVEEEEVGTEEEEENIYHVLCPVETSEGSGEFKWYGVFVSGLPSFLKVKYWRGATIGIGWGVAKPDNMWDSLEYALEMMKYDAIERGANAIMNFRITNFSYEGSPGWGYSAPMVYGEAVELEIVDGDFGIEGTLQEATLKELQRLNSNVEFLMSKLNKII